MIMSIIVRKQKLKRGTHLSFVESKYDKKIKNTRQRTLKNIGYLEDLLDKYPDPYEHFQQEARRMNEENERKRKEENQERIPRDGCEKNIGSFLIQSIYKKFNMKGECDFLTQRLKVKYELEQIYGFLLKSQIVMPGSKKKEFENRNVFIDEYTFSDDQMYDAINLIGKNTDYILQHIQYELRKFYNPDLSHTLFDGTNVYFEVDKTNELVKRGPEKNNRHDPIVGFGLLTDARCIPLSYTLFPGNQNEQSELHKNVQLLKSKNDITGRTIIVADKGLNSGDNMYIATKNGDGYVFSQKVRNSSKENIAWALDENGYRVIKNEEGTVTFKIKSEVSTYPVTITSPLNNQKATINLKQKRVMFYSLDYDLRSKEKRRHRIEKAKQLITEPSAYRKNNIGDAASYIKEIHFTKDGEIASNSILEIDEEAIKKEEALDGYYMIVTSETKLEDEKIIEIYRSLWEIEQSFSIFKGILKVRPVFAKTIDGIKAHFIICFHALLILRLLQKVYLIKKLSDEQIQAIDEANKRKKKYKINIPKYEEKPMGQIVDFIRQFTASYEEGEYYKFNKYIPIMSYIEEIIGFKLDVHRQDDKRVKKIFSLDLQHKIN